MAGFSGITISISHRLFSVVVFLTRLDLGGLAPRNSASGMTLAISIHAINSRRMNMIRPFMAAILVSAISAPVQAQGVEDLDQLDNRVQAMTGAAPGQPGGAIAPIDRRLKLIACPQPASIEWSGSDSLAIRCPSVGWRLRVGVAGAAGRQTRLEMSVHRGDTVEVSVEGSSFDVTTSAIALDDGAIGQSVRVKLGGSGTQSSATVTGPGTASFSR